MNFGLKIKTQKFNDYWKEQSALNKILKNNTKRMNHSIYFIIK